MMSANAERASFILLSKILQLLLVIVATIFMRRENMLIKLRSIIPLLLCQIVSIYICDNMLSLSRKSDSNILSYHFIVILLGILYLNVIIVIYAEVIKRRQEEQYVANLHEQELTSQLSYYKSIQLAQERNRSLCHDMRKHLAAMESMVSSHNKSSAAQLLEDLKNSFQETENLVDVGNLELSAILNHYVQLAKESNIPVSLSIWVPPTLSISPLDLNIVIGNSFENAIEACLALPTPQRKISIHMTLHNKYLLFYEISNPYLPGKKVRLHKTTTYHGYGLQNITKIADKYNGNMRITHGDQMFTLAAYFNLPNTQTVETSSK